MTDVGTTQIPPIGGYLAGLRLAVRAQGGHVLEPDTEPEPADCEECDGDGCEWCEPDTYDPPDQGVQS